eukprot:PhM_4_TR10202/c0_g1_i1/m.40879
MFFLVQNTAFVCGHHVLDVNKCILTTVNFEQLQRFLDQLAKVRPLPLPVVDLIQGRLVAGLEEVQHRQKLTVVRHERLANQISGHHKLLHHLQYGAHDLRVACVERRLNRNDQLRDRRQDLCAALLEQVNAPLQGEKVVGLLNLAKSVEENREVVVIVQLLDVNLPVDLVAVAALVLDGDGEVAAVVEAAELCRRDVAGLRGTRLWGLRWHWLRTLVHAAAAASCARARRAEVTARLRCLQCLLRAHDLNAERDLGTFLRHRPVRRELPKERRVLGDLGGVLHARGVALHGGGIGLDFI